MKPGVYKATKKDGTIYYRASITYQGKHISLGSFSSESKAHIAYLEAGSIIDSDEENLLNYKHQNSVLSYDKLVSLFNFRDNKIYFKNPIYLQKGYFLYYLSQSRILKFDNDDLFYYSQHKIQCRGNHLFVAYYGMQCSILSRFGIKPFSVAGRDYSFANGDDTDYRYSNIIVINKYHGVQKEIKNGITKYKSVIHVNGDFIIGRYSSEEEAAIAYNKASDYCKKMGLKKDFFQNFIEEMSPREYANIYTQIHLPSKLIKQLKISASSE